MSKGDGVYPENLRYTKEHEWLQIHGSIGTVGVTHYAQGELGDIVYVERPKVGTAVVAGAALVSSELLLWLFVLVFYVLLWVLLGA